MSLLALVDQLDFGPGLLHYKPGQGERYGLDVYLSAVLTDPASPPVLTLHGPDGSSSTPTVVHDGAGLYHADYALAATAPPGVWVARWTATGGAPVNDACIERRFVVDALDF